MRVVWRRLASGEIVCNGFVVFLVVLFVILALIENYPLQSCAVVSAVIFGWLMVYLWKKDREDARAEAAASARLQAERHAAEAARLAKEKARQAAYDDEQAALQRRIHADIELALTTFEQLPQHLAKAEQLLDQAEVEFADRAFAPFWDLVEEATNTVGRFDEGLRKIGDASTSYQRSRASFDGDVPGFPLARNTVERLGVGSGTAERLRLVVRQAQRDFQFATIFEQRKTNAILIAGFTSLGDALNRLGGQVQSSLLLLTQSVDSLSDTVSEVGISVVDEIEAVRSDLETAITAHQEERAERRAEAEGNSERQLKALEMLDNIQRRRKPAF